MNVCLVFARAALGKVSSDAPCDDETWLDICIEDTRAEEGGNVDEGCRDSGLG